MVQESYPLRSGGKKKSIERVASLIMETRRDEW